MAASKWNIGNFLAEVASGGLAKPCRFETTINIPPCVKNSVVGQTVSMYCEQAMLPYTRIMTSRQQIFGPPSLHPIGVEYNGESISFQFYVDRDMNVKRFFDAWVDGIIDRKTFTAFYQTNYLTEIVISQLDEQDSVTYQVKLIDAFPTAVQGLQLDSGSANQVHRLSVTFAFRKWEEIAIAPDARPEASKSVPAQNLSIRNGSIEYNIAPNMGVNSNGKPVTANYNSQGGYFIIK